MTWACGCGSAERSVCTRSGCPHGKLEEQKIENERTEAMNRLAESNNNLAKAMRLTCGVGGDL